MEAVVVPKITVSFAVDLEVEYDSFSGKTPEEFAIAIQDELDDILWEANPRVKSVYSSITSISTND